MKPLKMTPQKRYPLRQPSNANLVQVQLQLACAGAAFCDLVQFQLNDHALPVDRVWPDSSLLRLLLTHLSHYAEVASDAVVRGAQEETHIPDLSPMDRREMKTEIEESRRTNVGETLWFGV